MDAAVRGPVTWTYTEEYYKNYTRDTWNESAPHYGPVLRMLDQYTPDLLRHAKPKAGERVLDVATGPGEPALTIAPLVGSSGMVLGIDLSEKMIDIARAEAKRRGVANVDFEVMDAERMTFPVAGFVTSPVRLLSAATALPAIQRGTVSTSVYFSAGLFISLVPSRRP